MTLKAIQTLHKLMEADPQRVCAYCTKERGIASGPNMSHGMCRRHTMDYIQAMRAELGDEGMDELEAETVRRPDNDFPPDLANASA
jgi:hypothetical protein